MLGLRRAHSPAFRSVHTADVASIVQRIARVRDLSRPGSHRGAPAEGEGDEERGKASLPIHRFPPQRPGELISHKQRLRQLVVSVANLTSNV
jgi:hypothetical protein